MANVSEGDFPSLHIVLERIEPARNIARYYVLSIEPTLNRPARARTSGENLFVILLIMAPPSQELGPPENPGRFRASSHQRLNAGTRRPRL